MVEATPSVIELQSSLIDHALAALRKFFRDVL